MHKMSGEGQRDHFGDRVPCPAAGVEERQKVPARELERVLKAVHESALFPVS